MIATMKVILLALTIYSEAGGTDPATMQCVADTVVNRMESKSYPDTVDGVILQRGQYWISRYPHRSVSDLERTRDILVHRKEPHSSNPVVWNEALDIAQRALKPDYLPTCSYTNFYSGRQPSDAHGKKIHRKGKMFFFKHR